MCRVNLEESIIAVHSLIDELLGGVCAYLDWVLLRRCGPAPTGKSE
jgi:hypothetical protein